MIEAMERVETAEDGAMEVDAGAGEAENGVGVGMKVRGPWSAAEDAVLTELVNKFGPRNWSMIASGIPGRSGKSCRLRWCNQLNPYLKRKPFTGKIMLRSLCFMISIFVLWRSGEEFVTMEINSSFSTSFFSVLILWRRK